LEAIINFAREFILRKTTAMIACVIAALLLLLTLWQFVSDIRERRALHAELEKKVEMARPKPAAALPEQIALGLFGKRPISPDIYAPAAGGAYKLELNGVLATPDGEGGSATISAEGVGEHTYVVGDLLPGHAVIKAIFSDRVVLERNKRLETLLLPPRGLPANR
jgi:type II secretory pathway component PulC